MEDETLGSGGSLLLSYVGGWGWGGGVWHLKIGRGALI